MYPFFPFLFARYSVTSSGLFRLADLAISLSLRSVTLIVVSARWSFFIPHRVLIISSSKRLRV